MMTRDEMRFARREFIKAYLPDIRDFSRPMSLFGIKYYVRFLERVNYGYELAVYHG